MRDGSIRERKVEGRAEPDDERGEMTRRDCALWK
jgi:hypothetical protein